MKWLAVSSVLLVTIVIFCLTPSASALPVSFNTTTISLPFSTTLKNSSSFDVFASYQIPFTQLYYPFNNNTLDFSSAANNGIVNYNSNLMAIWKYENTVTDSSSNGDNGVVSGVTTYVGGHEGNGFSYNGATFVNYSRPTNLTFERTNTFSFSFWIKGDNTHPTGSIISKMNTVAPNPGYDILFRTDLHAIQVIIANHQGAPNNQINVYGSSVVDDNNWHHVVVTYDGSSTAAGVKIYVDTVLNTNTVVSDTLSSSILSTKAVLTGNDNAGSALTAVVDELRVYNIKLSVEQIGALYEVGHFAQSHTFDGGEFVRTTSNIELTNLQPFSFGVWVKTTNMTSPEIFNIISGGAGLKLYLDSSGHPSIFFGGVTASTSVNVADGSYHDVVWVYDGSGNMAGVTVYIDNVAHSLSSNPIGAFSNNVQAIIGIDSDLLTSVFTGQLDDAFFIQKAITPTQVSQYFAAPFTIPPNDLGPLQNSWYHGISGSSVLTKVLGGGLSTLNLGCSPISTQQTLIANNTSIYYICGGNPAAVYKTDIFSGLNTILRHVPTVAGSWTHLFPFITKNQILAFSFDDGVSSTLSTNAGNFSLGNPASETMTNQKVNINSLGMYKYNFNGTALVTQSGTSCDFSFVPTNATEPIDSIACDPIFTPLLQRYTQGYLIQGSALFYTNSTQYFLNSIDANSYKHLLSMPCSLLSMSTPCVTMVLTDNNNAKWFIGVDANHIRYNSANTLNSLINQNRAWQSYDMVNIVTGSSYPMLPYNSLSWNLYGFSINSTLSSTGLFSIPSGYNFKPMSSTTNIRNVDPRWTDDTTDIPVIFTGNTVFPIFLTVANAPAFGAIKATNPYELIGNQESVWSVTQLDGTRSAEIDLPPSQCANIYVADISVSPSIWNFQGIICATGTNQKTISYTSTLPLNFWNLPYGVTDTFVPTTNSLTTYFHSTQAPVSYTVILKNSTGAIFSNNTYTLAANSTLDVKTFNVTSISKPAGLFVYVGSNLIYSSYLGSALSLASVSSFFNTYLSYQGFSLLAFIPIVFASMFTRNTVGIGVVLTVLCIATLSWLSIVVIPDLYIYIMILIAIIGLIAYRIYYG